MSGSSMSSGEGESYHISGDDEGYISTESDVIISRQGTINVYYPHLQRPYFLCTKSPGGRYCNVRLHMAI